MRKIFYTLILSQFFVISPAFSCTYMFSINFLNLSASALTPVNPITASVIDANHSVLSWYTPLAYHNSLMGSSVSAGNLPSKLKLTVTYIDNVQKQYTATIDAKNYCDKNQTQTFSFPGDFAEQ